MMKRARVAFSGSGFLAGVHAGAACALLDAGYDIVEVAGTSGGSIVAAAVALGMRQDGLHGLAVEADFSGLLDGGPLTFLRRRAWDSGDALLDWLDRAFDHRAIIQAPIPLQVVATDVHSGAPFVFSQATTPAVSLSVACRASSAVPFVYAPVQYGEHLLADGGMVQNIPVDRLHVDDSLRIGIDVDGGSSYSTDTLPAYAGSLLHLMLAACEDTEIHLAQSTGATVVKVPTGGAFFLDTEMPRPQKQALFDAGYQRVKAAL